MDYIQGAVNSVGYCFLPAFRPDAEGEVIARLLGDPLLLSERGLVHRLLPSPSKQATPNTYSGLYGLSSFPFHTDLAHHACPPPFFMLRCVIGFADVLTPLIDGRPLVDAVGATLLKRALVRPRRPLNGRFQLLRLFDDHVGASGLLRWDETFIRPASAAGEEACSRLALMIATASVIQITLANPGDTLIVDNWRMLHARSLVPPECRDRVIERAYLREIA